MGITVQQIYLNDKDLDFRWSQIPDDFWYDLKKEQAMNVKKLLESTMEIQVQDLIGSGRWEHNYARSTYRNGFRLRALTTSFGYINNIKVPRIRDGKINFTCIPYYKQRTADIDNSILEMFLAGVSTRRVHEAIAPLLGQKIVSSSTVSRITKVLNKSVNHFHSRKLSNDYVYLLLDGVYFNVKNPIWKNRRCILVAYGIKSNGQRELIDFHLASKGESQNAWELFLTRLFHRGLVDALLKLIVIDGNKGLRNAVNTVFPFANIQLCWAHKLRNVANKLPAKFHDACINQARDIYNSKDYPSALKTFKHWAKFWHPIVPNAVDCIAHDIDLLLNFFKEPKSLQIKLRTTNIIERCFREVRRRTKPMSCFQNSDSIQRIIFAVFYRLNKNWVAKPLKITHNS